MSEYATLDQLKGRTSAERDHELPSGAVVRIRPLTRSESFRIAGKNLPVPVMEQKMISMGLVEPSMTEADVKDWQSSGDAGEIQDLSERIVEISGMTKQTAKEAMLDFRDES